ncbi:MAG: histidine kinase dimerization/phospho-acceptor domain-containing protein [Asticcacaulis sp.]
MRDISEQKATEAALARASLEANAAAEAKANFLATMSHELRTPLTSIIGFSALLRDLLTHQPDLKGHATRIHSSGQNLLGLINDILDHSRLDAGHLDLDPQPSAVAALVEEVADLLSVQAQAKGIELRVAGADDLPAAAADRRNAGAADPAQSRRQRHQVHRSRQRHHRAHPCTTATSASACAIPASASRPKASATCSSAFRRSIPTRAAPASAC